MFTYGEALDKEASVLIEFGIQYGGMQKHSGSPNWKFSEPHFFFF